MKKINTSKALLPLGHYSQAIVKENVIYVSGQLPIDPNDEDAVFVTPEEQTLRTLQNLEVVLKAAGGTKKFGCKSNHLYIGHCVMGGCKQCIF